MIDKSYDVLIVGGGLAGLTAAIHLSGGGLQVLVVEKAAYPHHKVCGEYLSNEVCPYLDYLGIQLQGAISITEFQLSTIRGRSLTTSLPLGGQGISRYTLDHIMYRKALEKGATVVKDTVTSVKNTDGGFSVGTTAGNSISCRLVIGAYGKRSQLDRQMDRQFIKRKSPWLGVKGHYSIKNFPDHLVALHTFNGGYAGLSKIETGMVNFCYLAHYKSFEKEKDVHSFTRKTVAANPHLSAFLKEATPVFEQPLTIAQISFENKRAVEGKMLMCGDTAGLIHPLCGNGMAMAIHSAKIASELILNLLDRKPFDPEQLYKAYQIAWNRNFAIRMRVGRHLQSVLMQPLLCDRLIGLTVSSPWLLQQLIRRTHGQPIRS